MRIPCLIAILFLTACTTTGEVDMAIQKSLPQVCASAEVAHAGFIAVAAVTTKIKERTVRQELLAYDALKPLCANPSSATSATVLITATTAALQIATALKEAEKVQ